VPFVRVADIDLLRSETTLEGTLAGTAAQWFDQGKAGAPQSFARPWLRESDR
jgi:hypothetical protein